MNENYENIKKIAETIDLAKGDRTITQYSKDSGVSTAHISRILNGKLRVVPTKDVLYKLTNPNTAMPRGGVTYEDALRVAGYDVDNEEYYRKHELKNNDISSFFYQEYFIIFNYIYRDLINLSNDKPTIDDIKFFDSVEHSVFGLNDNKYGISIWHFRFLYNNTGRVQKAENYQVIGELLYSIKDIDDSIKITIALNTIHDYEFFTRSNIDIPFKANLSVMLLDLENMCITEEKYIAHYSASSLKNDFYIGDN